MLILKFATNQLFVGLLAFFISICSTCFTKFLIDFFCVI